MVFQQLEHAIDVEGLLQDADDVIAELGRDLRPFGLGAGGDDGDGKAFGLGVAAHPAQNRDPADARHLQIEQDEAREIFAGGQVCDRFLAVRGTLHTYHIHLGSGNVLMKPNDQFLCIVPGRSMSESLSEIFLPFEGDSMLSIILSKAFMLADDTKISDASITSQLKR